MNILFLDIDGVLTSQRVCTGMQSKCPREKLWSTFDPVAVSFINDHFDNGKWNIVISSSWRDCFRPRDLLMMLTMSGIKVPLHDEWRTERFPGQARGLEINAWLKDNEMSGKTNYIILDDNSDMLPEQVPQFVQTDGLDGMLTMHMHKIIELKDRIEAQNEQ